MLQSHLRDKSDATYSNSSRTNREKIFCLISMFPSSFVSLLRLRSDQIDFPVHPRSCHRYITRAHPGDSVRAYIRTTNLASGPKIPRCSRFTRERAVLFWSESSWRVHARGRGTTNELKRLSSFKCIRKINFPSQIG